MSENRGDGLLIDASTFASLWKSVIPYAGFAVKRVDGRYETISHEFGIAFDKSGEIFIGKTDEELFSKEIADQLKASDMQVRDLHSVVDVDVCFRLERGSVHTRWIKYPVADMKGAGVAIGMVVFELMANDDISEVRCSFEQLIKCNSWFKKEMARFEREAGTDKLTGAWNRHRFEETVIAEIERRVRYLHPLSMMVIDIDHFKEINDEYGHIVGDAVLATFTQVVQSALRITDSLTRWGGDEFVVLSPETNQSAMAIQAGRLRGIVQRTIFPHKKPVTISIGVAEWSCDEDWEAWFMRADQALYRAKERGRNQVQCSHDACFQDAGETSVPRMDVNLVWHSAYECGHPVIDSQHRAMFLSVNRLLQTIVGGGQIPKSKYRLNN